MRKRRSIRLKDYDYSQAGAYYITICTRDRECLFGNVVNGQMQLNEAGRIVRAVWDGLPRFYEGIELDAVVVMPNHLHGIIVICAAVGAIHESPLPSKQAKLLRIAERRRMLLSKIIGRFKMVTAKNINDLRGVSGLAVWQRNYYEHIVRNDESLHRIRQYIVENPAQWEFDRENPAVIVSDRRGNS
jgi:REP element-mobilizing transposase RayT